VDLHIHFKNALFCCFHFKVHESSGLQNKLLTEVFIPVPEASKVSGMQTDLDAVEFSSNVEVVYQHDGVGSGRFLDEYLENRCILP
jgi:hypothetical protein